MSSTIQDKVIEGMEKTALSSGYPLVVTIERPYEVWLIKFTAGNAIVSSALGTFVRAPQVLLEPFLEEVIKRNL